MKVGLLLSFYNEYEFIRKCLEPWVNYKRAGGDIFISIINAKFEGNENQERDKERVIQELSCFQEDIDYLYISDNVYGEAQARNLPLKECIDANCEIIWTIGIDEIYTAENIKSILSYVESHSLYSYYSINFLNLTFNDRTFTRGFNPSRIWRVKTAGCVLNGFYWDDNCQFFTHDSRTIPDTQLGKKEIPPSVAEVLHHTWNCPERSKAKVAYQNRHFSEDKGGFGCSFKWNEDLNKLEFNEDYFRRTGTIKPQLYYL